MPKVRLPCQRYSYHAKGMVISVDYAAGVLLFHRWFLFDICLSFIDGTGAGDRKKTKDLTALRSRNYLTLS